MPAYYFFDTSALNKRYVLEAGSQAVLALVNESADNRIFIAPITPIELTSALERHARDANISPRTLKANLLLMHRHVRREYFVLPLDQRFVSRSIELLGKYQLRTLDAIQLAFALDVQEQLVNGGLGALTFVCADKRLLLGASQAGFAILEPK
jgi:uncharacterized protein